MPSAGGAPVPISGTSISSNSSSSATSTTSSVAAASSASSSSSGSTSLAGSTSSSSSASSNSSIQSNTSDASTTCATALSNSEYKDRIDELTALAKSSFAAKEQICQQMVQAVNEVKRVEVELDRAGQQCSELDSRQKTLASQIEQLEKRSKQLDADLKLAIKAKASG